jgi:YVTN family beta-propeller protein
VKRWSIVLAVLATLVALGVLSPSLAAARIAYVAGTEQEEIIITGTGSHTAATGEPGAYAVPVDLGTETVGTQVQFGGRGAPLAIAISPDASTAYVVDTRHEQVVPIDVATNTPGTPVPIGSGGEAIAITPDGSRAYVANYGENTVTRIDLATGTPHTITGFHGPSGVAITPDGTKAYVTNYNDNTVSPIDLSNDSLGTAIPVGNEPWGIAVTPDGSRAYVADFGADAVTRIDLPAETVGATVSTVPSPELIAISPDGARAYVIGGSHPITPIDLATDTAEAGISEGDFLSGLAILPDGSRVYLTDGNTDFLAKLTEPGDTLSQAFHVGKSLSAIAISPNQPPQAAFTASPSPAITGQTVSFDAGSSADPDGTVARYDWDFGDGTTEQDAGPEPDHTYAEAGAYQVTVTETDDEGCSTELVFTGQTSYCNGSEAARATHTVEVEDEAEEEPEQEQEPAPQKPAPTPIPVPKGSSCATVGGNASSFVPKFRSSHVVPGVRVRLAVEAPAHLAIETTLVWSEEGKAEKVQLGSLAVDVDHWRRIRLPIPSSLREKLPLGTIVGLKMTIQSTPREGSGCTGIVSKRKLRVHVVKVIPDAVQAQ